MMQYDGDAHVPKQYIVEPPSIERTMGEYLVASKVKLLAISETQKYGHVTYFFNGNRQGKFSEAYEDYVEVPSDRVPFEQRPWMKCAEITDKVLEAIESGKYAFIRLNYPNGDMVGHTGVYQAVVAGMEGMDLQLGRLRAAVEKAGGIMILTADHGNSDDMYEHDKKTGAVTRKADGTPARQDEPLAQPRALRRLRSRVQGRVRAEAARGLGHLEPRGHLSRAARLSGSLGLRRLGPDLQGLTGGPVVIEVELKAHLRDRVAALAAVAAFARPAGAVEKRDSYWHAPGWRESRGSTGFRLRYEHDSAVVNFLDEGLDDAVLVRLAEEGVHGGG